ncbi:DUF1304 domain-containing protein [Xanthomarina sp. F1114]|uniref:DUF1304 domain-containing protein n=1 Tax=Xanthomarina sp. F1114 TaxID=2996019 RepID=UPI00225DE2CD|nr:DUF1304 domain-containing protein [Xanthomarina sp. F1114]MCX7546772.1 DUF1304 domain-containing protein [Xanthomarina sp. F1114]
MSLISIFLICLVALEHLYFLLLEMFLWTTPKVIKIFGLKSQSFAKETKTLAANQGLYNGFLSAGLVFALVNNDVKTLIFFLICVIVAGIFGAITTKKPKLFILQSLPAGLALISLLF